MPLAQLDKPEILDYIHINERDDVALLALKKPPYPDWPWRLILDQIKARQQARDKLPEWHEREGIIFPSPGLMEQASSEACARYKASLAGGDAMADLTAGTGVDFHYMLANFNKGYAIEKDESTAALLTHNLNILGAKNFEVICGDAEHSLQKLPGLDWIYLDPQRRNNNKKGKFLFADCSPDAATLMPAIIAKAKNVMVKASPVLDIDAAIQSLHFGNTVHIVEHARECREVLYISGREKIAQEHVTIRAANIDESGHILQQFSFRRDEESACPVEYGPPETFLYEPGPAFLKAGCFKLLAKHYHLKKLHPHTHLYTGACFDPSFPGRIFEIVSSFPGDGKGLPVKKANLSTRNYPIGAEELRRKLKLKEGGDDYLFACTLPDERRAILYCRKATSVLK